jgi:hypothetical protein
MEFQLYMKSIRVKSLIFFTTELHGVTRSYTELHGVTQSDAVTGIY